MNYDKLIHSGPIDWPAIIFSKGQVLGDKNYEFSIRWTYYLLSWAFSWSGHIFVLIWFNAGQWYFFHWPAIHSWKFRGFLFLHNVFLSYESTLYFSFCQINSEVFEIHSGPMGALTMCRSPTLVTFGQVIILTCICNYNFTLYNHNFTQSRNLQYNSKILIYPQISFITS